VGPEPAEEVAVGEDVPEAIEREPQQHAVHQDSAALVAGESIGAPPGLEPSHVPREHQIEQPFGVPSGDLDRPLRHVEERRLAS
jgi:hypothetical protein